MALSDVPTHFEFASAPASTYDALRELWWFISGAHPTATNAIAWKCIEVWDGTAREAPTGGAMSNLDSGNLWFPTASPSGSLPEGAWAVFQSLGGLRTAKCQIFVRMEAASQAGHSLIALDDWSVGGGTGPSPTLPATIIGQPASGDGDGRFPNSATFIWSVIVDEGMFHMKMFATSGFSSSARWTYMGETDATTTEAEDPRPFITPRNTNQSWSGSYSHVRLSPVDDSTLAQLRNRPYYQETVNSAITYNDLGKEYLCNVALDSENPAGHRFIQGFFRNVGAIDETAAANRATAGYDGSDFRFEVFSQIVARPGVVSRYPPGTALAGHTVVTEESVPTQLIAPVTPVVLVNTNTSLSGTIRHLLPKSSIWNLVWDRGFKQLMEGITPTLNAGRDSFDDIWQDLFPATTRDLASWERQYALVAGTLTVAQRRTRLAAIWAAQGGQSPGYITDTLTAAGFAVFTHEWWDLTAWGHPAAKDPRDHLKAEYGGTDADGHLLVNRIRESRKVDEIGAGEIWAEAGEARAIAGYFLEHAISLKSFSYVGPESRHPYYLYIGGETFPDTVDIPAAQREEFETLCLQICPAQQWLVLRVRYV